MRMKKLFLALILAVIGCFSLFATACGGGDDGDGESYVVDVEIQTFDTTVQAGEEMDFTTLFKITANGQNIPVKQSMLQTNTLPPVGMPSGVYQIKLNYTSSDSIKHTAIATLKVEGDLDVALSAYYPAVTFIQTGALKLDATKLFSLKVNEKALIVTDSMLDLGGLSQTPAVGTYAVKLNYGSYQASCEVTVISSSDTVTLTAEDRTGGNDISTLDTSFRAESMFTVKENGISVPVTADMILYGSFQPDAKYLEMDTYIITCCYTATDGTVYAIQAQLEVSFYSDWY